MHDHLFRLHAAHLKQFGPVLSAKELTNAIDSAPAWWDNDNQSKHNAIFVIPPANAASIIEAVGKATPEYEKVTHSGPMLFWPAPINTFSRTRWSNVVSATGLYHSITIQNANTAKRLVRLVKGE